ncbi:hypothetical protein NDY24_04590 [Xanthomonas hortorum pv. pelargonii]|nr:hypothetical protein NDY24_04590 [Xanthomonas hortorum pv. pelargonii]
MNDPARTTRSSDIAAMAMATDANGHVDLTALEAHRLILNHQTIQGLDAPGLINDIVRSPAYANPQGREQVGTLIQAISSRLPPADAMRLEAARDSANVNESMLERISERFIEEPAAAAWKQVETSGGAALRWTDTEISDSPGRIAELVPRSSQQPTKQLPGTCRRHPLSQSCRGGQDSYGAMKGATSHGLNMLGDTVDLAKFAHQFSTDENFRNLVIGSAVVYGSQVVEDPGRCHAISATQR